MNDDHKKFALRMIPYGVFVVTAVNPATGAAAATTVHWLTQTSFSPCLLAVAIKSDHPVLTLIRQTNRFALNMLGKDDGAEAHTFYRPAALTGDPNKGTARLGGWRAAWGRRATLVLDNAVAVLECDLRAMMEAGDHFPVIAEPIDVHVRLPQDGRPDGMALHLSELGETIFYGG
jgi:flavin reductase (DIM6/NTAB) family NADH-FMN oxidoreductase RutF